MVFGENGGSSGETRRRKSKAWQRLRQRKHQQTGWPGVSKLARLKHSKTESMAKTRRRKLKAALAGAENAIENGRGGGGGSQRKLAGGSIITGGWPAASGAKIWRNSISRWKAKATASGKLKRSRRSRWRHGNESCYQAPAKWRQPAERSALKAAACWRIETKKMK